MSVQLTKADLLHIYRFVLLYEFNYEEYPELYSKDEEDELKIVKQLIQEKLDEVK